MSNGCQDSGAEGARAQHGTLRSLQGVNALLTPHAATCDSACMASTSQDQPAGSTAQSPQPPSTPLTPGAQHCTQGSASNFEIILQANGQGDAPQAPAAPGPAGLNILPFPGPEATACSAHPEADLYSCAVSTRTGAIAGEGLSTCNPPLAPGQGQAARAHPQTSPADPQGGATASPQASPSALHPLLVPPGVHPAAAPSSAQVPSPAATFTTPTQPLGAPPSCGGGSHPHLCSSPAASLPVPGCNTPQPAIIVLSTPHHPAPSYEDALHAPPCRDAPDPHRAADPALQGAQASTNAGAGDNEDRHTTHTAAIAAPGGADEGEEEDDDEADCTSLDSAYLSPASASDDSTSGSEPLTPTTPRPPPSAPLLPPCDDPHRKTLVLVRPGALPCPGCACPPAHRCTCCAWKAGGLSPRRCARCRTLWLARSSTGPLAAGCAGLLPLMNTLGPCPCQPDLSYDPHAAGPSIDPQDGILELQLEVLTCTLRTPFRSPSSVVLPPYPLDPLLASPAPSPFPFPSPRTWTAR